MTSTTRRDEPRTMSALATVRLVAEREVRQRLRSKLFVVTTLVLSVVLAIGAALPAVLGAFDDDAPDEVVATPDEPTVVVVVGELSTAEREALTTTFGPIEERTAADQAEAEAAVTDEDVAFGVVPGERVLEASSSSVLQFGGSLAFQAAEALALAGVLEQTGADPSEVATALTVAPLEVDLIGDEDPAETAARLVAANLGVVFLFAVLIMYASMIINGVIEEKGSRVVELLIEAVPVRQLMAGKILGLGLVGLGQTLLIFGPATIVLLTTSGDVIPAGVGGALAGSIVLWFVLGYAFYSVLAAGLGSLVSRPEEAQAVLTPANTLMVVGYFLAFVAINAPDSAFAVVFGWLPFSAPYVMLVRQAIGSPTWFEVLGSIVVMLVAIVGATLLAARLYRGGILRVGARVKLGDAWRSAER